MNGSPSGDGLTIGGFEQVAGATELLLLLVGEGRWPGQIQLVFRPHDEALSLGDLPEDLGKAQVILRNYCECNGHDCFRFSLHLAHAGRAVRMPPDTRVVPSMVTLLWTSPDAEKESV